MCSLYIIKVQVSIHLNIFVYHVKMLSSDGRPVFNEHLLPFMKGV